jgi:hypothetical protein
MSILDDADRQKRDTRPDEAFYNRPRFVTHSDDGFLTRLTALYDEFLAAGDDCLGAMGS